LRFGSCGQNILIASHPVPWFFVVESWWLERKQFTFGQPGENDLNQVHPSFEITLSKK